MMIAASILCATVLLAALIGLRYLSPVFRERMELPKYRFQETLRKQEPNDVQR
jgi:hypothetical protein